MSNHIIHVNKINLWFDTFGRHGAPTIVLIMGNSCQGIMWPEDFCRHLASANHYVIRFDYRDTGLSTCLDFEKHPYNLIDIMHDVLGLLDYLLIEKAHLVGMSMGGSIALLMATHHPERVKTVTVLMSSPDLSIKNNAFAGMDSSTELLPPPSKEFIAKVTALNQNIPNTREEKIQQFVGNWRLANGERAPFDEKYWHDLVAFGLSRQEQNPLAKNLQFANHGNHSRAQMATTEPNVKTLVLISAPVLVIHGTDDPIFPPPHGAVIARMVQHGSLMMIEKMGHALNPVFFETIIIAILGHAR